MTNSNDGSYQAYVQQQETNPKANLNMRRVTGAGADVRDTFSSFYRSNRVPEERPPRAPHFGITSRQKVADGEMVSWRLTYYDFSAGYAQDVDLTDGGGANMGSGQWDVRKRGKAVQQLATSSPSAGGTVDQMMLTWSQWDGLVVLGSGDNANRSLFYEAAVTPPTAPAFLPIAYAPGANQPILWHGPLQFLGTRYFVISRMDQAPEVYASPVGALVGTMDANLGSASGWLDMPVNISPGSALKLFMTAYGSLWSMSSSDAYNAAPTYVGSIADLFKMPMFTHPLGVVPWGRGVRAFWKAPEFGVVGASGGYTPGTHYHPRDLAAPDRLRRIRLAHCDVTGLDWDEAKIDELPYLTNATVWRNGLICTDDTNIIWKAGNGQYRRVYLNEQMPRLINRQRIVVDFGDRGRDCLIRIDEISIKGNTAATTTYDVALNGDTWGLSPASEVTTLTGLTGRRSLAGVGLGGGMPISPTGYSYGMAASGNFLARPALNGGQSGWDKRGQMTFASPCTGTLPDTVLPEPFCYLTSIADAVQFKGYLPSGFNLVVDWGKSHEDGTVAPTGAVATFNGPLNRASKRFPHTANTGPFSDILSATFTVTNESGDATETAQLLSIALEGHTLIPHGTDFNDDPRYLS